MNILWITNILFPEVKEYLSGIKISKGSGGWLIGLSNELSSMHDINLFVATVSISVKELTTFRGEKIVYFVIPFGKGNTKINNEYDAYWREVKKYAQPDVIHIHGTEFSHGLSYIKECGSDRVVISIQGLVGAIAKYYMSDISLLEIFHSLSLKSFVNRGLFHSRNVFSTRSKYENEYFRLVNNVIGRTSWDKMNVLAINDKLNYYKCWEILRPTFYCYEWHYSNCRKHSIFISQADYPIKGLHILLKALPIIIRKYPDVQVRVAGYDITQVSNFKSKLLISEYGNYLNKLILKYDLCSHIQFIGLLSEDEMLKEYLSSNVFVCPSSIENSPNSLAEAQMLGVPCVASYVGGIPDMVPNNNCGILYRFEEYNMLAYQICEVFANSESFDNSIMRQVASERHNPKSICDSIISIYNRILSTI